MRDLSGVHGERRIDGGLDRAGVAHLAQSLFLHDCGGIDAGLDHLGKDVLRDAAGDRAIGDEIQECAELLRSDRRLFDVAPLFVQRAEQIADDPIGRRLRIARFTVAARDALEIFGGGALGDEHVGILGP